MAKLLHLEGTSDFFLGKGKWSNLWEQIPVDYADPIFKRSPILHIYCFEMIARLELHRQLIHISSKTFVVMLLNLGGKQGWREELLIQRYYNKNSSSPPQSGDFLCKLGYSLDIWTASQIHNAGGILKSKTRVKQSFL